MHIHSVTTIYFNHLYTKFMIGLITPKTLLVQNSHKELLTIIYVTCIYKYLEINLFYNIEKLLLEYLLLLKYCLSTIVNNSYFFLEKSFF